MKLNAVSVLGCIFLALQWVPHTASEPNKGMSNNILERLRRRSAKGVCEKYQGTICSKYLGNQEIFISATSKQSQTRREGKVTFFAGFIKMYVSEKCKKVLLPSMCYYFFKPCVKNARTPTPREICRKDCQALKNDICKREMSYIQGSKIKIGPSDCKALPGPSSPGHSTCLSIGAAATQKVKFTVSLGNITMYEGKLVKLKCKLSTKKVRGNITWYKDGVLIGQNHSFYKTMRYKWGSRLKIRRLKLRDAGKFDCVVQVHGRSVAASSWVNVKPLWIPAVTGRTISIPKPPTESSDNHSTNGSTNQPTLKPNSKGYCEPYRGKACAGHLSGKSIFVTNPEHQENEEHKVTAAIHYIRSSGSMSAKCLEHGIPAMCYYYFPACDEKTGLHKHRLCREDCRILYDDVCLTELQIAQMYLISNSLLPVCKELPHPGTTDSSYCTPLGIQVPSTPSSLNDDSKDHTCYDGNGSTYRGRYNTSVSGFPCLPWAALFPNHTTHNYCRNLKGTKDAPWCFVAPNKAELCNVPKCGSQATEGKAVGAITSRASRTIYVIAAIIAVLIIAFVSIVVYLKVQHARWGLPSKRSSTGSISKSTQSTLQHPSMEITKSMADIKSCILNEIQEVSQGKVKFLEVLGEGGFARVCKGVLMINEKEMSDVRIAIKKLKHDAPVAAKENFKSELNIVAKLQDINLLCLVGVSAGDDPLFMVFEYYTDMDLHRCLTLGAPTGYGRNSVGGIDDINLLDFAMQIASGMDFLAENHFIHRDLATRNCYVTQDCIVKISNLGIGCYKYPADYSWVHGSSLLPVRWMSPEALNTIRFNHRSDIWSYGIVLWELYTYGRQPYIGCTNQEAIERIRNFQLLTCPDDCPARMYALMRDCWEEDPSERPAFSEITSRIRTWAGDSLDNSH